MRANKLFKLIRLRVSIAVTLCLMASSNTLAAENKDSPVFKDCIDVYSDDAFSMCDKCQTKKDRVSVLKNNLAWFDSKTIDNVTTPPKNESRKIKKLMDERRLFPDNYEELFKKAFYNPYYWEYQLINERSKIRLPTDKIYTASEPREYMSIIRKLSALKTTYYDYKDARGGFSKDDSYTAAMAFDSIFETIQNIHDCSLRDKKTITELNRFIKY